MGEVLDIRSRCFEERGDTLLRPPRIIQGRALGGRVSGLFSRFHIIMFSSPRRQPVDLPVLQAFLPSKTDKRQSMKTALPTGFQPFREPEAQTGHVGGPRLTPHRRSQTKEQRPLIGCVKEPRVSSKSSAVALSRRRIAPAGQEPH